MKKKIVKFFDWKKFKAIFILHWLIKQIIKIDVDSSVGGLGFNINLLVTYK